MPPPPYAETKNTEFTYTHNFIQIKITQKYIKSVHLRKLNSFSKYFISVEGAWGVWQVESCSKTCGNGTMKRVRECNNPTPKNCGSYCPGFNESIVDCMVQKCPGNLFPSPPTQANITAIEFSFRLVFYSHGNKYLR